ncbi:MAG TPA: LLM class flavin-dependent oxidoreductase [Actinomycetota bacterium]|nr:LLM class flavin-dependent oxidoreductase [Actinomycetota bacterium]
MTELSREVGLGLAARGSVSDVIGWAEQARNLGLSSVWVHDSYFERDAVTYASALASNVDGIKVALGAVNPFTRHAVLLAMTVSALDEMAPSRIILGLGSALPLRLAQMGIPYSPQEGHDRVSATIDLLRQMWKGERVPPGSEGVPPVEPMFAPVHHVPIFVAGYRTPMLELAGEKGDGYLARPLESLKSFQGMVPKIKRASVAAGRPEDAVQVAGYLFSLVDSSRRAALNRAKREPFVIYMMAIQTDVALRRAGLDLELRDRIFGLWRAEDYHEAAQLIPDEMMDAFLLCGTEEEVAARALDYHAAGMDTPVLQPVVQEDEQVEALFRAAELYGSQRSVGAVPVAPPAGSEQPAEWSEHRAGPGAPRGLGDASNLSLGARFRRHAGAWFEIVRPFSFTASTVPPVAAGALAALAGEFSWPFFLGALFALVLLHIGTNVVNEIYDVRKGADRITSPRASHALLKGRISEREAFTIVVVAFVAATAIGVWLTIERGPLVIALGLAGLVGGWGYTAPPLQYKFRALGLPIVFLLFGPLSVVGAYFVITGSFEWAAVWVSIPVGLLVTAILHGNEWRDISEDTRAGGVTLSIRLGRTVAHWVYLALVVGAYLALGAAVFAKSLPVESLLALLSMPLLVRVIQASELGAMGQQRAIAMLDLETAQLHAAFGFLLAAGIVIAAAAN